MSDTQLKQYSQYPRSSFPEKVDDWDNMQDMTGSLAAIAATYDQLYKSGQYDKAAELIAANPDLDRVLFNAEKINRIMDGIKALQQFFKDDVSDYIVGLANATIGIKDDAQTDEEISTNAYSVKKVLELYQALLTRITENKELSARVIPVNLATSQWSSNAPYTQTVNIENIQETDKPIIGLSISGEDSSEDVKAQTKAWGCVDRAVTGNGTITFYCYNKKPASNFNVNVKGV